MEVGIIPSNPSPEWSKALTTRTVNLQQVSHPQQHTQDEKGKSQDQMRVEKKLERIPNGTHLHYVQYSKMNLYCVQVVDNMTNKVIREIPPKQVLDMYVSMMERFGLLSGEKGRMVKHEHE